MSALYFNLIGLLISLWLNRSRITWPQDCKTQAGGVGVKRLQHSVYCIDGEPTACWADDHGGESGEQSVQ